MAPRSWSAALAVLSLAILGAFLFYTERVIREVRAEAALHTRMYAQVQRGLLSLEPGADLAALLDVQRTLTELGVPVVVVNARGEPYAAVNLPFAADLAEPADRARVLAFTAELDRHNPPISEPGTGTIHFGAPPVVAWLRWAPWLQVGVALALGVAGLLLVRTYARAERERLWAATARELAHQMGTPLSSLTGWVELLRLPAAERDDLAPLDRIAHEIEADVERLERVSRRFELIGKPPALEAVQAAAVTGELERYFRPRLPRLSGGVQLHVRLGAAIPPIRANRVLIVWALENLIKNALDALAGRAGRIRVAVVRTDTGYVRFRVSDTGPGIAPAVRERIFDPGTSTKVGGWGVGLALTRRIIEELHGGRIVSRARRGGGAIFEIDVPIQWPAVAVDEPDTGVAGTAAVERTAARGVSRSE